MEPRRPNLTCSLFWKIKHNFHQNPLPPLAAKRLSHAFVLYTSSTSFFWTTAVIIPPTRKGKVPHYAEMQQLWWFKGGFIADVCRGMGILALWNFCISGERRVPVQNAPPEKMDCNALVQNPGLQDNLLIIPACLPCILQSCTMLPHGFLSAFAYGLVSSVRGWFLGHF